MRAGKTWELQSLLLPPPAPTFSFVAKEIIESAQGLGETWSIGTDSNPDETIWERVTATVREFCSDFTSEVGESHLFQGVASYIGRFLSDWSKDAVQTFPYLGELFGRPSEDQPSTAQAAQQRRKINRPKAARQDLVNQVRDRAAEWAVGRAPSTSEERDFIAIVEDLADYGVGELEKDPRLAPLVRDPTYLNDVCERGLKIGDVLAHRLENGHGSEVRYALLNRFCVASPFAFANEADIKRKDEHLSSIEAEVHILEQLQNEGMLHPAIPVRATFEERRAELKIYYTAVFARLVQTVPYLEVDSDPLVARLNRPASVKFGERGIKMGAILLADLFVEQIEKLSGAEFLMPLVDKVIETTEAFDPFATPVEELPHPTLTAEEQECVSKLSTIVCRDMLANDSLAYFPLKFNTVLHNQANSFVGTYLHSVDGRTRVNAEPLVDWAEIVRDNILGRESPADPKKPATRIGSVIGKTLNLKERRKVLKAQMESYPWAFTNLAVHLMDDALYTLFPEMEMVGLVDRLEAPQAGEETKVQRKRVAQDLSALLKHARERTPVAISLHYHLMKKQYPGCWERLQAVCENEVSREDEEPLNQELLDHLLQFQGSKSAKELVKCALEWLHHHPIPSTIELVGSNGA